MASQTVQNTDLASAREMAWSKVDFLETGDSYFEALVRDFKAAKKSILLEYYIFHLDRLGRELLETL
ncbi:MAG: hypothetical protein KKB63_08285, partial [Alphaproteobacteria bacterium]|nr:hypothetical protein [Alphaproteobacteria bacterium]